MERMAGASFQARQLGQAARIWSRMLADPEATVFLGVAGGPRPPRARPGRPPPETDDVALGRLRFNRFYDVLAPETDFSAAEEFVVRFIRTLDTDRPYTTREFFALLGQALLPAAKEEG